MTIVSKSAYARHKGKSPSAVGHWIRNGQLKGPALVGQGRATMIDREEADAQLARCLDPGQQLGNGARKGAKPDKPALTDDPTAALLSIDDDPSDPDFGREKARLAKEQADAWEMKNAQARGELLKVDEVAHRWAAILSGTRSALLAVPKRLRDVLPDLSPSDLAKIDAEIRRALKSLSDGQFAIG